MKSVNDCSISWIHKEMKVTNTSSVGEFLSNPRYNDHNVGILCAASSKNGDLERIRRKGDTSSAKFARKGTAIGVQDKGKYTMQGPFPYQDVLANFGSLLMATRPLVSYDDITLPYQPTKPPSKKRKRNHEKSVSEQANEEEEESRELTHEEIWDDSALVNAWEAATEEYEAYHGSEKTWKTQAVNKAPL